MSKKPYLDPRWNDHPPIESSGKSELGLSEGEKTKSRKYLDEISMRFFNEHIDEKDIPDNLKANN
jgi:hypothetical protein